MDYRIWLKEAGLLVSIFLGRKSSPPPGSEIGQPGPLYQACQMRRSASTVSCLGAATVGDPTAEMRLL